MNKTRLVLVLLVATTFAFAAAPAAEAAPLGPPNIGDDGGCGYFHYHPGNIKAGVPPSYHYHHCM